MQIVRKKLTADEIQPPGTRYNPDCDCVQQSPDGGVTWIDVPALDPRSAPGFRLPALTIPDAQCLAAMNMRDKLKFFVDTDLASTSIISLASELLSAILLFIPGVGLIVDAILIVAGVILTIGAGDISASFTEEVYAQFLCVFLDNIDPDGQMSDDQLADIYTTVAAMFDATVQAVFGAHSSTLGAVGWSNAGVRGENETPECDDCVPTWCRTLDFTAHEGDVTPFLGGTWTDGIGWQATDETSGNSYRIAQFWLTLPSTVTIYRAEIVVELTKGASGFDADCLGLCAGEAVGDFTYCASSLASEVDDSPPDPTQSVDIALPSGAASGALFLEAVSSTNSVPVFFGAATIKRVTVWGEVDPPDWSVEGWDEC